MWYVVQVFTGDELKIAERLQREVKLEGEEIFVPLFERRKCVKGEWTKVTTPLFPGYLFFETDDVKDMHLRIRKLNVFTKVLKTGDVYTPISPEEEEFLRNLTGEDHVARQSIGVIEGDKVIVMEGPLYGLEGKIVKINRHKRIATIRSDFMGGARDIKVGLEIVEKRPAKPDQQ